MVSLPTEDTGITVKIPIKNSADKCTFYNLVEKIVYFGGMNVKLNSSILDTLDFDTLTDNCIINNKYNLHECLYVKYGAVVYPIPNNAAYENAYDILTSICHTVPNSIVFQVKPNSISITPSREAISLTSQTIGTITKLLNNFIDYYENNIERLYTELVIEFCNNNSIQDYYNLWIKQKFHSSDFILDNDGFDNIIKTLIKDCSECFPNQNSPVSIIDFIQTQNILLDSFKLADPNNFDFYNDIVITSDLTYNYRHRRIALQNWSKQHILFLQKELGDDFKYLKCTENRFSSSQMKSIINPNYIEFIYDAIPVVHSQKAGYQVLNQMDLTTSDGVVLVCPRKKGERQRILDKLKKSKVLYTDNTDISFSKPKVTQTYESRPKGLVKLSECIAENGTLKIISFNDADIKRSISGNSVFFVQDGIKLNEWSYTTNVRLISNLLPNAVIAACKDTYNNLINKGYKDGNIEIINLIKNYVKKSNKFKKQYVLNNPKKYSKLATLVELSKSNNSLKKQLKITKSKDKKLAEMVSLFNNMESVNYYFSDITKATKNILLELNLDKTTENILSVFKNIHLWDMFHIGNIENNVKYKYPNNREQLKIFLKTIKGN